MAKRQKKQNAAYDRQRAANARKQEQSRNNPKQSDSGKTSRFSKGVGNSVRRELQRQQPTHKFLAPPELFNMLTEQYEIAKQQGDEVPFREYINIYYKQKSINEIATDTPGVTSWVVVDQFKYKNNMVGGACKDWLLAIEKFEIEVLGLSPWDQDDNADTDSNAHTANTDTSESMIEVLRRNHTEELTCEKAPACMKTFLEKVQLAVSLDAPLHIPSGQFSSTETREALKQFKSEQPQYF